MIPTNEMETLTLFVQESHSADITVLVAQAQYPDLTIRRDGEILRAEVEFRASNFIRHGHDPRGCDLIICWENDWLDCRLPILELSDPQWRELPMWLATDAEKELEYYRTTLRRATVSEIRTQLVTSRRTNLELRREVRSLRRQLDAEKPPMRPPTDSAESDGAWIVWAIAHGAFTETAFVVADPVAIMGRFDISYSRALRTADLTQHAVDIAVQRVGLTTYVELARDFGDPLTAYFHLLEAERVGRPNA